MDRWVRICVAGWPGWGVVLAGAMMGQVLLESASVRADESVVGSPHDLSVSGPGIIHALEEQQVCIFCHAPHHATGQRPLWNRYERQVHYRIYASSTSDARIDQPSGPSKMCLSCHDGGLAIGLIASRGESDPVPMSRRTIPPGRSDLTEDLSDDHPIGLRYDRALAVRDRQLKNPDAVSAELPLGRHGELHCTTCHDPHNNELGDFLRRPQARSVLCLSCHEMNGWRTCGHALSPARTPGRSVDPRERLAFDTVAENACTNCHQIHSAEVPDRLLRLRREEDNCLNCHRGGVARANIENELRKPSGHPVTRYTGIHDPREDPRSMRRHVECADCHNPHAVADALGGSVVDRRRTNRSGPKEVGPTLRFVSGVDRTGRPLDHARWEYEVCLKCHADGPDAGPRTAIQREVHQTNTRLEFQVGNPSFHPVFGARRNPEVVSLRSPMNVGSVISCTDCHNSDDDTGDAVVSPTGPHGSIHAPLLVANYSTREFTVESPQAYALCYRCHDRTSILGDESFPLHQVHVVRGRSSCSACHDAHGISRTEGNTRRNSNLINFDRTIVQPVSSGAGSRLEFVDLGRQRGNCTLTCHGVTHVAFEYGR